MLAISPTSDMTVGAAIGTLLAFNLPGLAAYAIGSAAAYTSPWIALLVGVLVAALSYSVILVVSEAVRERRAQLMGAV